MGKSESHSWDWTIALLGLLVLPGVALGRLQWRFDAPWLIAIVPVLSLATFALYSADKRRAQRKGARTPELWLHALEFAGGWPGAFVAQRVVRHKNAKRSYQVVFFGIVALWQLAALDYLLGWRVARSIAQIAAF